MWRGMDTPAQMPPQPPCHLPDKCPTNRPGPKRDQSTGASLYFIAWIFIGAFFVVNLFVGVVIEKFQSIKDESNGIALLTDEQKEWVDTQKQMLQVKAQKMPIPPNGPWAKDMFRLAQSKYFELFIMAMIFLNILIMMAACVKIMGYGVLQYFADAWDCFDALLVIGS